MRKLSFQKVTLFVVYRTALMFCFTLFVIGFISLTQPKEVSACSYYDTYVCGSYGYSNYGAPYYGYGNGYYGYGTPYYGSYNYSPSPTYQYIPYQQSNPGNSGSSIFNYKYVQYPYYQYVPFQNAAPSNSQYGLNTNYVQYPYQTYIPYR